MWDRKRRRYISSAFRNQPWTDLVPAALSANPDEELVFSVKKIKNCGKSSSSRLWGLSFQWQDPSLLAGLHQRCCGSPDNTSCKTAGRWAPGCVCVQGLCTVILWLERGVAVSCWPGCRGVRKRNRVTRFFFVVFLRKPGLKGKLLSQRPHPNTPENLTMVCFKQSGSFRLLKLTNKKYLKRWSWLLHKMSLKKCKTSWWTRWDYIFNLQTNWSIDVIKMSKNPFSNSKMLVWV